MAALALLSLLAVESSLEGLRAVQVSRYGARLGRVSYADGHSTRDGVPLDFGEAAPQPLDAGGGASALFDRSHAAVLRLGGADRRRFLHGQCTNAIEPPRCDGAVVDACVLDANGRVVDLVLVADVGTPRDELLILASPNRGAQLAAHFEKVIFPLDDVCASLVPPGELAVFEAVGDGAADAVSRALGTAPPDGQGALVDGDVLVLGGGTLGRVHPRSLTLVVPGAAAAEVWCALCTRPDGAQALQPVGEVGWEAARIATGRPAAGAELTKEVNPLEAGLYHTISFTKGCYLGQETVSKVNNAPAPKQRLWGVALDSAAPAGTILHVDAADGGAPMRAGRVTSMLQSGRGLALVRTAAGGAGLRVRAGDDAHGALLDVPFASRTEAESAGPREASATGRPADGDAQAAAEAQRDAAAAAAEAERKAAKLAAMEARMAAFRKKAAAGRSPPEKTSPAPQSED